MATTTYFDKEVKDAAKGGLLHLDVGKTNYAGHGPQMYLKLGESYVILNHEDAKAFCEGVERAAFYFGYNKEGGA